MEDIGQNDIFANIKKDSNSLQAATTKVEKNKNIPIGYIPVALCSKDKLSPAILHFRNYSMSELLELSSAVEEKEFETLVNKALNNMVYEDFDCAKLHIENIKQIVLTIYKNFWNSTLFARPYYIDVDNLDKEDNTAYIDINLNKIKTIEINDKFKNPFTIEESGLKIKFTLPTVEHVFIAKEAIKEKYSEAEDKFQNLKSTLRLIDKLTDDKLLEQANAVKYDEKEKEQYDSLLEEKSKDYIRYLQAQLLYSIDGKVLETIQEKLDAYNDKIDALAWVHYNETVKKYAVFGIDPNYTFVVDGKELTRGFSFRPMVFIPTLDTKTNTKYSVYFDD